MTPEPHVSQSNMPPATGMLPSNVFPPVASVWPMSTTTGTLNTDYQQQAIALMAMLGSPAIKKNYVVEIFMANGDREYTTIYARSQEEAGFLAIDKNGEEVACVKIKPVVIGQKESF